jgi:predicted nucleic acid-binding Zn ribbon protein
VSKKQHIATKPIRQALDDLVNNLGIKQKLSEYDAVLLWEDTVGEQIAKMTTATRITQGVLFVRVKTGTWRNELTMRKKEIMEKLNSVIGINVVRDIKFH